MQDDLSSRLARAFEGAARYKKIAATLKQLRLDKDRLEQLIPQYKQEFAKENLDVYKLETSGVSSFFHSVFGSLDEKLQKERGEAAKAKLKCRNAEKELEELSGCIEALEAEMLSLQGCGEEYARLYGQKKQLLLQEHGLLAERIMELTGDINNSKAALKKIKDAVTAGEDARRYLSSAYDNLRKAETLGVFDMAATGNNRNFYVEMMAGVDKYNHIDSAALDSSIAQTALTKFQSELSALDIDICNPDTPLVAGQLMRFSDIFLDTLTMDWYAQKRINSSIRCVSMTKDEVQQKVTMLKTLEFEEQRRLRELQSKLDYIILGLKPGQKTLSGNINGYIE